MGWIPFKEVIKKDNKKYFKTLWRDLSDSFSTDDLNTYFYFPSTYNFNKCTSQLEIKISIYANLKNNKKFIKLSCLHNRGDRFDYKYNNTTIRFTITGGNRGSGVLKYENDTTKPPSNDHQELATILAIENIEFSICEINSLIGYEFDISWSKHLEESRKIRDYMINEKYIYNTITKIEHDATSKFASKIFTTIKKLGYNDKKDNWNPADFWILNRSEEEILSNLYQASSVNIFNSSMKELFNNITLIGVSLKKINDNIKIDIIDPSNRISKKFTLKSIIYIYGQENFFVETNEGFRIRVGKTAKSGSKSIYYEGNMKGSKVQLGAISRMQLVKEFVNYNYNILEWEKDESLSKPDILELHVEALKNIISQNDTFIEDMYYLAMKQSKDSSIYLKVH